MSETKEAGWKAAAWLIHKSEGITRKNKLAFFRELRSLGVLPAEATFFLLDWIITKDVPDGYDSHPGICRVQEEMDAIEERHFRGRTDSCFLPGKAPKRYQKLNEKWERLARELHADVLRKAGEHEIADLYLKDRGKHEKTYIAGRDYFHAEFDPEWTSKAMEKRSRAIRREMDRKAA